jgi:dipeptidyl aminopeptidase/acylaminoacyl peptidase
MRKSILLVLILVFFGSGCRGTVLQASNPPTAIPTTVLEITLDSSPTPTLVAATLTPTLKPTETATPTPEPNPMDIQVMRAGSYPGSDFTIEKELNPGANYHRYYASYLSQGLKIFGLLTVPDGEMPSDGWPAIIFNHGYIPPEIYRTTERYIAYVDRLAQAGYIVYKIDYRGHDQSEGVAAGAYGDPGYTIDVLNAVASIERFPQANPQKIGMYGHSMGGFLTLRAMVISHDIKAGVIWSGVVASYPDMISKWHHNGPAPTPQPNSRHWRNEWVQEYGTPEENPAFWNSISATSYLADLSGPLQLHHDVADSEVPLVFSETLAEDIQAAGGTVELYTYPGDDHNLTNSFTLAMNRTIEFFDRYLK